MRLHDPLPLEADRRLLFQKELLFPPNSTTRVLARAASERVGNLVSLLDLGCGSGLIGLHIAYNSSKRSTIALSMSDVSEVAAKVASGNAKQLGMEAKVRQGSLFEPWFGEKFDLIVSDVSGVAAEVADETDWFNGAPNDSGTDGSELAVKVISEAGAHLRDGGELVFPILSVSNESAISAAMFRCFEGVEELARVKLPLGLGETQIKALLRNNPYVRVERTNGFAFFEVSVFALRGPKT